MSAKIKKRNPVVLKIYKIFFIAMFIAWIIFAIKYCFPYSPFYNYTSSPLVSYQSYDDYINVIKKYETVYVKQYQKQLNRNYGTLYGAVSYGYGTINNRTDGKNEGDVVKNDGEYLYILSGNNPSIDLATYPYKMLDGTVTIVEAYPPGDMNVVSKINLIGWEFGDNYEKNKTYTDIYVSGQILVVLSIEYPWVYNYGHSNYGYADFSSYVTSADIYDITDKSHPIYKRTFKLDGYMDDSRVENDILYLFTTKNIKLHYNSHQPEISDQDRYISSYYDSAYGGKQYVQSDRLYTYLSKLNKNDDDVISSFNIAAIELSENIPANVSAYTNTHDFHIPQLYLSENNIYLMQYKWKSGIDYTDILKLSIDKTNIQYVASKKVPGYMLDQFSANEYNGNLRIATIEGNNGNHIFILDNNLNIISSVMNITYNREAIKSVQFDGDRGYIKTYVDTHPLFVLDLSDAQSPKITGKIKNTGYYYPYFQSLGNRLVLEAEADVYGGISDDIKVSLLDMSDPYNPKEISTLKLGGKASSTDIGYNHESFLNISRYSMFFLRGVFTDISVTERPYGDFTKQALIISYDRDNGLKLVQAFNGADYEYGDFLTMNKITYIESTMYHFDGDAVTAYDMNVPDGQNYIKIGSVSYK